MTEVTLSVDDVAKLQAFGRVYLDSQKRDGRQADIEDGGYAPENTAKVGGVAADRLRSLVERIEKLEEEKKALGGDIKDIYTEAKSAGFDIKTLRSLIRLRRQPAAEVEEQENMLDLYRRALDQ